MPQSPLHTEFANRACAQRCTDPGYTAPTGAEIRYLIEKVAGATQETVAALTGVYWTKEDGSNVVGDWLRGDHAIPYAAWRLLLIEFGVVKPDFLPIPPDVDFADYCERECTLRFNTPGYRPPTPEEFTEVTKRAGIPQKALAKLLGVNWTTKGSTTIRKWKTAKGKPEHRAVPYAAWRMTLLALGIVPVK